MEYLLFLQTTWAWMTFSFWRRTIRSAGRSHLTSDYEDTEAVLKLLNYYSAEEAHFYEVDGRKEGQKNFEAIIDQHNVVQLRAALEKEGLLKKGSFQEMEMSTPTNNFGMGVLGYYPDEGIATRRISLSCLPCT
jgi:hypothetical protein